MMERRMTKDVPHVAALISFFMFQRLMPLNGDFQF